MQPPTLDEVAGITPADLEELPPVVRQVSETIMRGQRKFASAEAMAMVIVCSGEVRKGLEALQTVEALKTVHVKRTWEDGQTVVCLICNKAWPCPTGQILGLAA